MTYNSGDYFMRHATQTATAACEEFFEWVSHFNGDFSQDAQESFDTLFDYFEAWTVNKKEAIDRTFADGSGVLTWEAFAPLLPCIYIGIIDRLLVDPSRLDYVHSDSILRTELTIPRPMRRVSWLSGRPDNYEDNMDWMLNWVRSPRTDTTSERYAYIYEPPSHANDEQ